MSQPSYHMTMRARRPVIVALLLTALIAAPGTAAQQTSREVRQRASDLVYNLDHEEAIKLLRQAVAADPNDSRNYRALASAVWLLILYQRGGVTVDHYLGSFSRSSVDMKKPNAELDAEFKQAVAKAIELAEKRVAASPKDVQAQFDLGTAVGLQASYIASVVGKLMAGFRAARRSR